MKYIIMLLTAVFILAFYGCTPATKGSIIGTWEQTHTTFGAPVILSHFYKFSDNDTYKDSYSISTLDSDTPENYSMTDNVLKLDTGSFDVYILDRTMYWYQNNIEQNRFKKY